MIRIILNGAGGRMGHEMCAAAERSADVEIVAQIDRTAPGFELTKIAQYKGEADVIVDFSHHSATSELVSYALAHRMPLVIAPTGQTDDERALIAEAAKSIPLFFSANMSLGVAVLMKLARLAAAAFPDADIEIVESHHNRKQDAPSGTAMMLANTVAEVRPGAEFVYGRHGMQPRSKNEIGIHSLRLGNEPGDHQIIIATDTETLRLEHSAESRSVFADGALAAAKFIVGRAPGLYDMKSVLSEGI